MIKIIYKCDKCGHESYDVDVDPHGNEILTCGNCGHSEKLSFID